MVAQMPPVMVLQGIEPSCLLRLGITSWEDTEAIGLKIVSCANLNIPGSQTRHDQIPYQVSIFSEVGPGFFLHMLKIDFVRCHNEDDITLNDCQHTKKFSIPRRRESRIERTYLSVIAIS